MNELVEHLERQLESNRRLLEIVLAQGEAIKVQDVQTVLARLADVQHEMVKRAQLERERDGLLRTAAQVLRVPADQVNLDMLLTLPPSPPQHAAALSAELKGLLAEVGRIHRQNRMLIRQELSFLDHLMRVLSGTPQAGYSPTGWTSAPQPPTSWTRGPERDASRPSWASRPRCAACWRTSRRSTSPATTSPTRAPPATRARPAVARDHARSRAEVATAGRSQLGTGVDRHRLPAHPRRASSTSSCARRRCSRARRRRPQDGLSQVEIVFSEPLRHRPQLAACSATTGRPWQNVANSPQDMATRQALVEAATSLADGFNSSPAQLTTIQAQTAQNVQLTLTQINSIGTQIAQLNLNRSPSVEATGDTPNDLLDKRDLLLDELSSLGNVSTVDNGDGDDRGHLRRRHASDGDDAHRLRERRHDLEQQALAESDAHRRLDRQARRADHPARHHHPRLPDAR